LDAVNWIIEHKGGIAVCDGKTTVGLSLKIAGIISEGTLEVAARKYQDLSDLVKKLGSKMKAPFMSLAFMALLVIPELKLSDKGLFSGKKFEFVSLFYEEQ
jgi:adenine deaminase